MAVAKKSAASSTKGNGNTPAKKASEKTIKYEDKSAGQPQLIPIFNSLKQLMKPYVTGSIQEAGGTGGAYSLVSKKEAEVEGRKKDEVWFAGLLVQKGYVGFYFNPVYTNAEIKKIFQPELLKCLKGKSCFYIKKDDSALMKQIEDALKAGYELYKRKGLVD